MGSVERAGDATSEMESAEEEEMVGGGELAQHLMNRLSDFSLAEKISTYKPLLGGGHSMLEKYAVVPPPPPTLRARPELSVNHDRNLIRDRACDGDRFRKHCDKAADCVRADCGVPQGILAASAARSVHQTLLLISTSPECSTKRERLRRTALATFAPLVRDGKTSDSAPLHIFYYSVVPTGLTRGEALSTITARIHAAAVASLPANVRRRVRALRALQRQFVDVEAQFYSEVHALECKYEKLYKPLFEKVTLCNELDEHSIATVLSTFLSGDYEPKDEECVNPWRDDSEEEELARGVRSAAISDLAPNDAPPSDQTQPTEPDVDPNVKGIPGFWYTIFKNVSMLSEMMQEHDEPILKCLQDIKVNMHEDPIGFTLEFHFAPNDYFTNTVLTKEYFMKCKPDDESPLEFEGPEIYSCKGCEINWKKGKNVTVKTIKKKQKHKSRGSVRTVTKSVQADSFFNFFAPPSMPEDADSGLIADVQTLLTADFEIGHYIRERVVSRAVLLFTGEGLDEDDDDDFEEEEEECSTEESEEEELPPRRRSAKKALPSNKGSGQPQAQGNPAECKQQ
ncbi:Nucleosome assembly protein 1-like 4 [Eumeta japonica]|uniref:Nucleosome assembly protein 1-like 4 n=1 Tax=Eumeta variegata TaxID=151549 RepID=A0A4C1VUU5_EUMVA|nr:Nucleosome assembly protein 1-like 4 [Eumeta japonica]